jgi:hypothetical protein
MALFLYVVFMVVGGVVCHSQAKTKGRDTAGWTLFGVLCPLPAIIIICLLGTVGKHCAYCRKAIAYDATVCPYCTREQPKPEPLVEVSEGKEGQATCPKCGPTRVHFRERGWNWGTGLRWSGELVPTCVKCGYKFKPGEDKPKDADNLTHGPDKGRVDAETQADEPKDSGPLRGTLRRDPDKGWVDAQAQEDKSEMLPDRSPYSAGKWLQTKGPSEGTFIGRHWLVLTLVLLFVVTLVVIQVICANGKGHSHATPVTSIPQGSLPSSQATQPSTPEPELERLGSSWHEESGYAVFDGQVKNVSNEPLKVEAVVSFYDSKGGFMMSQDALVNYNPRANPDWSPILPGQTLSYEVLAPWNPEMARTSVEFQTKDGGTIVTR